MQSPQCKVQKVDKSTPFVLNRLVGDSNVSSVTVSGVETSGLIDTGSMITSISEKFYQSLQPLPVLHDITEFGLSVESATGAHLPYKGYIEADISVPFLVDVSFCIPLLVVPTTSYNSNVPIIVGTNLIRLCKNYSIENSLPEEWQTAVDSLCNSVQVRTVNTHAIKVHPNEVKTIHGFARKVDDTETAVTEHIDSCLSGGLTICPRVVSLKSPGNTVRVPVRVCNLSAKVIYIQPKSLLCSLHSVKVVDSWKPESPEQCQTSSETSKLEEMGVKIGVENLNQDQLLRVRQVLGNWSHIFSTGPTDLGKTDIVQHEIKLNNDTPFKDAYRRIPPGMIEEVRQHLKEMLDGKNGCRCN